MMLISDRYLILSMNVRLEHRDTVTGNKVMNLVYIAWVRIVPHAFYITVKKIGAKVERRKRLKIIYIFSKLQQEVIKELPFNAVKPIIQRIPSTHYHRSSNAPLGSPT